MSHLGQLGPLWDEIRKLLLSPLENSNVHRDGASPWNSEKMYRIETKLLEPDLLGSSPT